MKKLILLIVALLVVAAGNALALDGWMYDAYDIIEEDFGESSGYSYFANFEPSGYALVALEAKCPDVLFSRAEIYATSGIDDMFVWANWYDTNVVMDDIFYVYYDSTIHYDWYMNYRGGAYPCSVEIGIFWP